MFDINTSDNIGPINVSVGLSIPVPWGAKSYLMHQSGIHWVTYFDIVHCNMSKKHKLVIAWVGAVFLI